MSAARHTPGPWYAGQLREQGSQPGVDLVADDGLCVALVRHGQDADSRAETLANARLIAAAPDLYGALVAIVKAVERAAAHGVDLTGHIGTGRALAALAKAEGRS